VNEKATFAQAKATKAMAEATLKKIKIQEDANLLILMSHPTNTDISKCMSMYFQLKQEQEL